MFRAEPLIKVQLLMLASEAQDAALELARFGAFNPVSCSVDQLAESPAIAAIARPGWRPIPACPSCSNNAATPGFCTFPMPPRRRRWPICRNSTTG
jgi:hypothetical protein